MVVDSTVIRIPCATIRESISSRTASSKEPWTSYSAMEDPSTR